MIAANRYVGTWAAESRSLSCRTLAARRCGVIPIPVEWTALPQITVAISVDGLQEHHDERRKPATYDRILRNMEGRKVYIHRTAVHAHVRDVSYAERYLEVWSAREEVRRIWMSVQTPQRGEQSADLGTRVAPCVFGGSESGCAISSALHWITNENLVTRHLLDASLGMGAAVARLKKAS